ncbi:MAG: T9SS type A sorting domain-containing protein [Vicingaceae bacterium]
MNWQTASEVNNDYFTIERSENTLDWDEITTINGAGNSFVNLSYSATDYQPYNGTSYYRLKQTDFDGQFEYSKIRSVNIQELLNSQIEIYPNPAITQIIIKGSSNELEEIAIYNTLGQNLTSLIKQVITNENQYVIDVSKLHAGMYYVKTKTITNKVYKQ